MVLGYRGHDALGGLAGWHPVRRVATARGYVAFVVPATAVVRLSFLGAAASPTSTGGSAIGVLLVATPGALAAGGIRSSVIALRVAVRDVGHRRVSTVPGNG